MVQPSSLQKRSQVLGVRKDWDGFVKVVCMAAVRIVHVQSFISSKTQIPPICEHLTGVSTPEECSPQATTSSGSNWICLYVCIDREKWTSTFISTGQPCPSCLPMLWFPQEPGQPELSYGMFQPGSLPRIDKACHHPWVASQFRCGLKGWVRSNCTPNVRCFKLSGMKLDWS